MAHPSIMAHNFSQAPQANIQRSAFKRPHGHKTAFDSGLLVPIFVDEVLPGDTFNLRTSLLARLATPIAPIMDNLFLDTQFFFVPYRLIWDNFQRFMGERPNPGDSIDFLIPTLKHTPTRGSIYDYMGIPPGKAVEHAAGPLRAYNLIYNEWYRSQDLQDSLDVPTGDGPDDPSIYALRRRTKRHDYFTSALPWPQKGPGVELPLGGTIPIVTSSPSDTQFTWRFGSNTPVSFQRQDGSIRGIGLETAPAYEVRLTGVGSQSSDWNLFYDDAKWNTSHISSVTGLYGDLSQATSVTINSMRLAFQMQRFLERDARGGTRYTEILRSHFGVVSPDARLQRPEYLGGSSSRIHIRPVQQTSSTDGVSPQGNLAAYGIAGDTSHGFNKSFVEHGFIIGLASVRADLTYQQGLSRLWSRKTRYDFYWPVFAHLGEQEILNKELYVSGDESVDNDIFGYQERWAEYRYKPSIITGKMRSTDPQSLDVWHLSQEFSTTPMLNEQFILENPPLKRVLAVQDEPEIIADFYFDLLTVRPMPVYSVPGFIDHF